MRAVAYLVMVGVAIGFIIWTVQRWRFRDGLPQRHPLLLAPRPQLEPDAEARATLAFGPDRGSGVLRLSPSQLVFTGDAGRVLVIERLDIVGVTTTASLPDRDVAQPVLAVTTRADTHYFAVHAPREWERRLT